MAIDEKLKAKVDEVKGEAKETFGKLTGDKETEAEGFAEKTIAKGKELAEDAKEAIDDAKDKVEGVIDALKDKLK